MNKHPLHQHTSSKCITTKRFTDHDYVNGPIYKGSTVCYQHLEQLEALSQDTLKQTPPVYGRFGTPTCKEFEHIMTQLESGFDAICTCSGLAAITSALFAFAQSGCHMLISESVYLPTRKFCQRLCHFGVTVEFYDPCIGAAIDAYIRPNTALVYLESPGSLTFEIQDIPAITQVCQARGVVTIVDNTWATPLFLNPIALGVDVVVHSCSKYISGHSDVILGVIIARNADLYHSLRTATIALGQCAGNEDIYTATRGIRTLAVRLQHSQMQAQTFALWLMECAQVQQVIHPMLATHPQHDIWQRDFVGASGVFAFLLPAHITKQQIAAFIDGLQIFKIGFSWGGFESLMIVSSQPYQAPLPTTIAQPGWLFRISLGFEHLEDLQADFMHALCQAGLH